MMPTTPTPTPMLTTPIATSSPMSKERMLLRWLVSEQIPYSVVENEDFRNFCHALDPTFQVPSAQDLMAMVLRNI
jgi:hypothetical protein